MEYGIGCGVNVIPTELTRVRTARFYWIMRGNFLTMITKYAIGIAIVFQPFQTSAIIMKFIHELFDRVFLHGRFVVFLGHLFTYLDGINLYLYNSTKRTYCQGIVANYLISLQFEYWVR